MSQDNLSKQKTLETTISYHSTHGYEMVSKNTELNQCIMCRPEEKVNHLLHFTVSVFLGSSIFWIKVFLVMAEIGNSIGLFMLVWPLVWVIVTLTRSKRKVVTITVNEKGNPETLYI